MDALEVGGIHNCVVPNDIEFIAAAWLDTVGSVPTGSLAFHTPITGCIFSTVATPDSFTAVISIVQLVFAFTVVFRHAENPVEHSNPHHHPVGLEADGFVSVLSGELHQAMAASA